MNTLKHPIVSIGLPVYNGEDFLKYALDSLLSQTFRDFELIISDNASTDNTPKICQEYVLRDKRIRYIKIKRDKNIYERVCNLYELSQREVDLYSDTFKINIEKYE